MMNSGPLHNSPSGIYNSKLWRLLWIAATLSIFTLHGYASDPKKQSLETIEIVGISISTPTEMIAGILKTRGYTQVNASLYTKQEYLQNGRSAIFRIEIEDNAIFRQITYFRNLGGGRMKSPAARDTPVPDSDIGMATQLYQSVCADTSEELQQERACSPYTPANISFGNGQLIPVNEHYAAVLNATDAATIIGIKYKK
jgi:hypothetical protein